MLLRSHLVREGDAHDCYKDGENGFVQGKGGWSEVKPRRRSLAKSFLTCEALMGSASMIKQ